MPLLLAPAAATLLLVLAHLQQAVPMLEGLRACLGVCTFATAAPAEVCHQARCGVQNPEARVWVDLSENPLRGMCRLTAACLMWCSRCFR